MRVICLGNGEPVRLPVAPLLAGGTAKGLEALAEHELLHVRALAGAVQ